MVHGIMHPIVERVSEMEIINEIEDKIRDQWLCDVSDTSVTNNQMGGIRKL